MRVVLLKKFTYVKYVGALYTLILFTMCGENAWCDRSIIFGRTARTYKNPNATVRRHQILLEKLANES